MPSINIKNTKEITQHLIFEFTQRVRYIPDNSSIKLFYHGDGDGVCAAAAATALISRLQPNHSISASWIGTHQFDFALVEAYLSANVGATVFFFDLNLSSRRGFFEYLLSQTKNSITIVDDHVLNETTNQLENILFNPNFGRKNEDTINFPASLFTYLSALTAQVEVPHWLPALGLFADRQLDAYRYLISDELPDRSELFETVAELSNVYLDPATSNDDSYVLNHLLEHIHSQSSWKSFRVATRADPVLRRTQRHVGDALSSELSLQRGKGPRRVFSGSNPIQVFEQASSFRFTNILASRLRADYRDSVVFVYRKEEEYCFFEIRVGDCIESYDIVSVLRKVSSTINLRNYGGHGRAAGGACESALFDEMVNRYADLDATVPR